MFRTGPHTLSITRPIALLAVLLLSGTLLSCVGIDHIHRAEETVMEKARPAPTPPEKKPDLLQDVYTNFILASIHISRGNYNQARNYLATAVEKDPDSIFLNSKMAILLQKLKDTEGALKYAKRCIEIDPQDVNSHLLIAELYAIAGDKESEQKEYETILKLNPEHQRVRLILATFFMRKGQLDDAMGHLDELIRQNPEVFIAYYYRGRIHLELGNMDKAEEEYLHALDLNKSLEPALLDLANLYQFQNKLQKAIDIYKSLLISYPDNIAAKERLIKLYSKLGQKDNIDKLIEDIKERSKPGARERQTLGYFYLQDGRFEESIAELDLIVSAWPEDYKSRYYLGLAYEKYGQEEKALEHFRQIKKGSELYIIAQIRSASILEDLERYDEAIAILRTAIEIAKDKGDLYLNLAYIFEKKEEYDNAIEVLKEGLKNDEKNIDLVFRLGVVLDKSGDKDSSIDQMRKILEIDPDHADSLNYIGYTYAEKGIRLDEALSLIKRALSIKPESGYIIDSLGWVYYQKGLYDEALASLEKAFSLIPNDPVIAEHLGDVYYKKSRYRKSLEMYQKALSLEHKSADKILEKIENVKEVLKTEPGI